jgi:hypothetical protein
MMPDQVVTVAVALISLGTAALKVVSEILSSRNHQEKTVVF